ncbi:MAG: phosphonate metabolism transcriptional regulator PhnF [Pararhodobacter sp.]
MPRTAIWHSIAQSLAAEIAARQYLPGDKLPTEAALAARFGVNRHTVRQALADLAARGLVHARRGAGVFVTASPAEYPLGRRVRFHQNILASGRMPARRILRQETRRGALPETAALLLPDGAMVHVVEGLSLADNLPIAHFCSIFPAAALPGFLPALAQSQSVTAALKACGVHDYTRASTRLTARRAEAFLARHLQLPEGAPVLHTESLNVDAAGNAVEYCESSFAGDRATLTVTPEAPA